MSQSDFASALHTDTSLIPVIDVSGAVNGTDIKGVAAAIYNAATDHGFFIYRAMASRPNCSRRRFQFPEISLPCQRATKRQLPWTRISEGGWRKACLILLGPKPMI